MVLNEMRPAVELVAPDTPQHYVELMISCWDHDPDARPHCKQVSAKLSTGAVPTND